MRWKRVGFRVGKSWTLRTHPQISELPKRVGSALAPRKLKLDFEAPGAPGARGERFGGCSKTPHGVRSALEARWLPRWKNVFFSDWTSASL